MKQATKDDIKKEKALISNVWKVMSDAIDSHPNTPFSWEDVVVVTNSLNEVVASCETAALKGFAEQMSKSIVSYVLTVKPTDNHDAEVKVINEMFALMKRGYFVKESETLDDDWKMLMDTAKTFTNQAEERIADFAVKMAISVLNYLEKRE